MHFFTRSQAARAATKAGHKNFKTMPDLTHRGFWRFHGMPGISPAAEWATGKDFVNHVESDYIDEGRQPGMVGVLVITCTLEEIAHENVPEGFRIEPITPSLFKPDTPDTGRDAKRSNGSGGTSAPRAKSDVESPTKLVWKIADGMPGATRADVVEACVAAGVNKATASTQFYRWQKAQNK